MTTDPRALIAEAMEQYEYTSVHGYGVQAGTMHRLATGYESALDEVERLTVEACKEAAATHELAEEHEKQGMDLAFHRRGHRAALDEIERLTAERTRQVMLGAIAECKLASALEQVESFAGQHEDHLKEICDLQQEAATAREGLATEIVTLRTSLGEQALVIEQQDRDLTALTEQADSWRTQAQQLAARVAQQDMDIAAARDMNRHFEQERDAWPAAYKQRAQVTDVKIKALEGEVERMRAALTKIRSDALNDRGLPPRYVAGLAARIDDTLDPTGAPCTTK